MGSHVQRFALVWQMSTSVKNTHKHLLNDVNGNDDDNDDKDGNYSEI